MTRRQQLDEREAIDRLLDLRRSRYLPPYMGSERSVSQAARRLGVSIATMAYQTRRLLEAGLVEQTRTQSRAGRPIAFYHSTADEYVIALADAGIDDFEQFELDAEEPLRRAFIRGLLLTMASGVDANELAIRFRRLPDGSIDVSPCNISGEELERQPGAWTSWTTLMLSPDDAEELTDELEQLWSRWRTRHRRDGAPHLLASPSSHNCAIGHAGRAPEAATAVALILRVSRCTGVKPVSRDVSAVTVARRS